MSVNRPKCACGKPVWKNTHPEAQGKCWKCGEMAIREATVRRLVKSGAMAAMRRAMEACPDAGRTKAAPVGLVNESRERALGLLVGMANAERNCGTDGEVAVSPRRRDGKTIHSRGLASTIPARVTPSGLKFVGGK